MNSLDLWSLLLTLILIFYTSSFPLTNVLIFIKQLVQKLNEVRGFKAYTPAAAFYVMVNVTEAMELAGVKKGDLEGFRRMVLKETGVSFCTREHFGAQLPEEQQQYVRYDPLSIPLSPPPPSPSSFASLLFLPPLVPLLPLLSSPPSSPPHFLTLLQICIFWNRHHSHYRGYRCTKGLHAKEGHLGPCLGVVCHVIYVIYVIIMLL